MNATVSALSFTSGDQTFRTDRFSYLLCGTAADAPFRCEGSRWELSEDRAAVELPELSLRVSCRFVKNFEKSMLSPCTFALRYDTIEAPKDLLIRSRKQGDEIRLQGGRKTLKKLFIDRKISASQRALVPVVTDGARVLLVYPFAVSSEHGAQPGAAAILIQFMHEKEYIQKEDTQ